MEIWDGYDKNGNLTGTDLVRGQPVPDGMYHLVCRVLVQHADGSYLIMHRDPCKQNHPGAWEATAAGSALKGETALACAWRELAEETGITEGSMHSLGRVVEEKGHYLCERFVCLTHTDKSKITLQEGETVGFAWLTENEFRRFVRGGQMIPNHKKQYSDYFIQKGYL